MEKMDGGAGRLNLRHLFGNPGGEETAETGEEKG